MWKKGEKFGKLTLVSNIDGSFDRFYSTKKSIFMCDCGNKHFATLNNVSRGIVTHCTECSLRRKSNLHKTHGHSECRKSENPLGYKCYYTWQAMKRRCYYSKDKRFSNYGGRGIKICDEWKNSYENFLNDMGLPPTSSHSIERIDNDSNYCKSNCKWILVEHQAKNKSNNRKITFNGVTMNLADWSRDTGIKRETIARRLNNGWSIEKALTKSTKKV